MVTLLEKIERREIVSKEASDEILKVLRRQQDRNGIARRMGTTPVANKAGALDRLRSDVGIVYSKGGRIAIAITCDDMPASGLVERQSGSADDRAAVGDSGRGTGEVIALA
jgi:hypothetical protein